MLNVKKMLTKGLNAIYALNLKETGTISCNVSATAISYRKGGHWVNLLFDGVTNAQIPAGAYTTLGTLPSGIRPNAYVINDALTSRTSNNLMIEVQTNGIIRCYNYGSAIPSGTNLRFNIMFLTT